MPNISPFELYTEDYDKWFERNSLTYEAEIEAVRAFISSDAEGVEIGVGSGKFAVPLGIKVGVEPSAAMANKARQLGIKILSGVAERLPIEDKRFDFALMVTTICFVDDPLVSLKEAARILKKNGFLILAFVDKNSPVGKDYLQKKNQSKFYRPAVFYSTEELLTLLKQAGFRNFEFR